MLTSGCFDLLHPGHVAFLEAARGLGDKLVVAVSDDPFVAAQKGAGRPVFPVAERHAMLTALRHVDRVVINEWPDAAKLITALRPAVYAKGADYAGGDPSGRLALEQAAVESIGGALVILDTWPRYSSSALLARP